MSEDNLFSLYVHLTFLVMSITGVKKKIEEGGNESVNKLGKYFDWPY